MKKTGLKISKEVEIELLKFQVRHNIDEEEAWRRILSLMKISNEQADKGNIVAFIDENKQVVTSVVGF